MADRDGGSTDNLSELALEIGGQWYVVASGETVIGCHPSCDIRFRGEGISRRHLRLVGDPATGAFIVEDLSSTNGTWLNGRLLDRPRRLEGGDALRLGPHRVVVQKLWNRSCCWFMRAPDAPSRPLAKRRRDPRVPAEVVARLAGQTTFVGVASDLSQRGLFITGRSDEPVGSCCRLVLLPLGRPPMIMEGRVRHRLSERTDAGHPAGLGIELICVEERAWVWLQRELRSAGG
jgi:pSer/pThr/pTyr-binding forkhead associated (FHA) protein